MLNNFVGIQYRLANNWFGNVDINNYKDKPINYLEIGTFYGANILSVAKTYGLHSDSKLYCIDPWEDYDEYHEYKNQQSTIYNSFINNIENRSDTKTIYNDTQNVHSSSIQQSIKDSIFNLMKNYNDNDEYQYQLNIISNHILTEKTKEALIEYSNSKEVHSIMNITFEELLKAVFIEIETLEQENQKSILKILNQESLNPQFARKPCYLFIKHFNIHISTI
jgi:hypothetical protein